MATPKPTIGKTYLVKISGEEVPVRIESENPDGGWIGRSIKTGREVPIKTARRLGKECTADEQAKASREAKPNRRSRKKAPAKGSPKKAAKPKPDRKTTRKASKDKRREAIIDAIVAVLSTDPKKAMAVGEIHVALVESDTHAACGKPTHGALFYALKFEIEKNPKTRIRKNDAEIGAAYFLRKKR